MQGKNIVCGSGFSIDGELALLKNAIDTDRASKSISLLRIWDNKEITFPTDMLFGHRYQFDFSNDTDYTWDIDDICQGTIKVENGSIILDPQNAYLIITYYVLHSNCDNTFYFYWYNSTDNENWSNYGVRRVIYNHPRNSEGALIATAQGDVQLSSFVFYTDTLYAPKYWRPSIMVGLPDSNFSGSTDVVVKREEFIIIGFPKWAL